MANTTTQKNTESTSSGVDTATARLKMHRQSPRKVRLVADSIRGKKVQEALTILQFADKRAAQPILKLVKSALANAKDKGLEEEGLKIRKILVDGGAILYRRRARARGAASPIRKRTSHITVELSK